MSESMEKALDDGAAPGLPVEEVKSDEASEPSHIDHVKRLGEHVGTLGELVDKLSGMVGTVTSGDRPERVMEADESPVKDGWIFKKVM